jgi:hypothetical protein
MSKTQGFTKSYRSKWEHPIFRNKQEAAVWAWMCDVAVWDDDRIGTKFGPINLKRGELLIAERTIAGDFGLHKNTVRELLRKMALDGMIELSKDRCPARAGTVVKVVNYDAYQTIGRSFSGPQTGPQTVPQTGPQTENKRTAKGPQNNQSDQEVILDFENTEDRKIAAVRTANGTANCTATRTKIKETKETKEVKEKEGSKIYIADHEVAEAVIETVEAEYIPAGSVVPFPQPKPPAPVIPTIDAEFQEFYAAYPLKKDPGRAEKAYRTARKATDHATIMAGVVAYAAERAGQDPHFTKHPTTWLNARAWLNETTTLFGGNGNGGYRKSNGDRGSGFYEAGLRYAEAGLS